MPFAEMVCKKFSVKRFLQIFRVLWSEKTLMDINVPYRVKTGELHTWLH